MAVAQALFSFNFLLFFLFLLHPNFNSRNDKGPFLSGQGQKHRRDQMQFVKAIVSNVRFTITFTN